MLNLSLICVVGDIAYFTQKHIHDSVSIKTDIDSGI